MGTYFVYGALMTHPHVLAAGEAAYVDDHAVRFTLRGLPLLEPWFSMLVAEPGARAWGAVVTLPEDEWQPIRRHERPYVERAVVAVTKSGERREAQALFVRAARVSKTEGTPSARYANLLLRGAEQFGLPDDVVARYRDLVERGPRLTLGIARLLGRGVHAKGPRA